MSDKIVRNVLLRQKDFDIVKHFIEKKGLGEKGFSAAVRIIIREWNEMQMGHLSESTYARLINQPTDQSESLVVKQLIARFSDETSNN